MANDKIIEKKDWGLEFLYNWFATFPGKDHCHFCHKKLGIFDSKEIVAHFGFSYRVCKDCYREYYHKGSIKFSDLLPTRPAYKKN